MSAFIRDISPFDFSMRLATDSLQSAQRSLETYHATPKHDLNRLRDLQAARAWLGAAKINVAIAEREASVPTRTLKPLRARRVAKGAS